MFGFFRRKPAPQVDSPFDVTPEGVWEPAIVQFAPDARTIQLLMLPGSGHADGGISYQIEVNLIPFELRMPNTRIMARRENGRIVSVQHPGPKAKRWFRTHVDIPSMSREQLLASLVESPSHVVLRLETGATLEGWILDIDNTQVVFCHAPSPFYAQATGTNEMSPPDERIPLEEVVAWMDEDGQWHDIPRPPDPA